MGVALSIDDLNAMADKCRDGETFRLNDRPGGGEQHVVLWLGKSFRVVYLCDRNRIVTVLDRIGKTRSKCAPKGKRS